MSFRLPLWCMTIGLGVVAMEAHAQAHRASVIVFGEVPENFAVDPVAQRVFVPLTGANRVAEIALPGNLVEVDSHEPGNAPKRVNLNADGSELWIALKGNGRVARLQRTTGAIQEFDVAAALGSLATWDAMPGLSGEVYVSASPSAGIAHVARLDVASGIATRVAGGEAVSLSPYFEIDRNAGWLYLGERSSPYKLRKLDATAAEAPIIAAATPEVGSSSLSLKPDGSQIVVGGWSIVLWTSTLTSAGQPLLGVPAYRPDSDEIGVFSTGSITVRETSGYTVARDVNAFGCGFTQQPQHFVALPRGDGWLLLAGNRLCKVEDSDFVHASGF